MPALLGSAQLCSLCPAGGAAEPAPGPGIKSREGAEKCDRDGAVGRGRKRIGERRGKKKQTKKPPKTTTREREQRNRDPGGQAAAVAGLLGCGEKLAGLPEQQEQTALSKSACKSTT